MNRTQRNAVYRTVRSALKYHGHTLPTYEQLEHNYQVITAATHKAKDSQRMIDLMGMLCYPKLFNLDSWPDGKLLAKLFDDAEDYYLYDWDPVDPYHKMRNEVLEFARYGEGTIEDAEAAIEEWLDYLASSMKQLRITTLDYRVFEADEDEDFGIEARPVPDKHREFMTRWFKYMFKEQTTAHKWLRNNAANFLSPKLKRVYENTADEDMKEATEEFGPRLKNLAKKLTGKNLTGNNVYLDYEREELDELVKSAGQAGQQYLETLKEMNTLQREETNKFLRKQSEPIPLPELNSHLKKLGLRTFNEAFVGLVGPNTSTTKTAPIWYTSDGEELDGGPTVQAIEVKMNPRYKPGGGKHGSDFYVMVRTGKTTNRYTTGKRTRVKRQETFEHVRYGISQEKELAKKWRRYLDDPTSRFYEIAAIIEIMYQTGGRVGTQGTEGTGISTLQVKHTTFTGPLSKPKKVRFIYKQKTSSGTENNDYIFERNDGFLDTKTKEATNNMIDCVANSVHEDSDPDDFIFSKPNGNPFTRNVLPFVKSKLGLKKTHTLRYMVATSIFMDGVEKVKKEWQSKKYVPDMKEISEVVLDLADKCADQLGHVMRKGEGGTKPNINTSIKYYIDPEVIIDLFNGMGHEVPNPIRKRMHPRSFA